MEYFVVFLVLVVFAFRRLSATDPGLKCPKADYAAASIIEISLRD